MITTLALPATTVALTWGAPGWARADVDGTRHAADDQAQADCRQAKNNAARQQPRHTRTDHPSITNPPRKSPKDLSVSFPVDI